MGSARRPSRRRSALRCDAARGSRGTSPRAALRSNRSRLVGRLGRGACALRLRCRERSGRDPRAREGAAIRSTKRSSGGAFGKDFASIEHGRSAVGEARCRSSNASRSRSANERTDRRRPRRAGTSRVASSDQRRVERGRTVDREYDRFSHRRRCERVLRSSKSLGCRARCSRRSRRRRERAEVSGNLPRDVAFSVAPAASAPQCARARGAAYGDDASWNVDRRRRCRPAARRSRKSHRRFRRCRWSNRFRAREGRSCRSRARGFLLAPLPTVLGPERRRLRTPGDPRQPRPSPCVGIAVKRVADAFLGLVAMLACVGGCGREDVQLSLASADASASSQVGPDASDEAICARDGGLRACRPLDRECVAGVECCSGRCEGGSCIAEGTCLGPGSPCMNRDGCCSGRCEPIAGTSNRACTVACRGEGKPCSAAADCCSFGCAGGVCVARQCAKRGDGCSANADCCAGTCTDGRCTPSEGGICRPTGEDCTSGGGGPCCSGTCVGDRCDVGPGACRPRGAPCTQDGECCRGPCALDASGTRVCAAPCGTDGSSCGSSADCCSGACSGGAGTCVSTTGSCALVGASCSSGPECCSGLCLGNRCVEPCSQLR